MVPILTRLALQSIVWCRWYCLGFIFITSSRNCLVYLYNQLKILFGVIAFTALPVPQSQSRSAVLLAVSYNPESCEHLHLKDVREVMRKLEYIHLISKNGRLWTLERSAICSIHLLNALILKGWGPIAKLLPLVDSFLLSTNEKPLFFPKPIQLVPKHCILILIL